MSSSKNRCPLSESDTYKNVRINEDLKKTHHTILKSTLDLKMNQNFTPLGPITGQWCSRWLLRAHLTLWDPCRNLSDSCCRTLLSLTRLLNISQANQMLSRGILNRHQLANQQLWQRSGTMSGSPSKSQMDPVPGPSSSTRWKHCSRPLPELLICSKDDDTQCIYNIIVLGLYPFLSQPGIMVWWLLGPNFIK